MSAGLAAVLRLVELESRSAVVADQCAGRIRKGFAVCKNILKTGGSRPIRAETPESSQQRQYKPRNAAKGSETRSAMGTALHAQSYDSSFVKRFLSTTAAKWPMAQRACEKALVSVNFEWASQHIRNSLGEVVPLAE